MNSTAIIGLAEGWDRIERFGIQKLIRMIESEDAKVQFTNAEYMALYTDCYQMCIQKPPDCFAKELYDRYDETFSNYLTNHSYPAIISKSDKFLIQELVKRWQDHTVMMKWMYDLFRYIDRYYVGRNSKDNLKELALMRFRTLVFTRVKSAATTALLDMIKKDRDGEENDRDLLKAAIRIYVEMGKRYEVQGTNSNNKMNSTIDISLYCDDFETQFIAATVDYYSIASERWLADDGCPEYLRKAEAHIDEEHKRLHDFLNVTSEKKLMQGLYDTLLVKHQSVVLEQKQRCKNMLENNATQDLARMFSLYSNVPSTLPAIADIFKVYIQELGNGFLNTATPLITGKNEAAEQSARSQYIEQLMRIHSQNLLLVTTCFNGNTVFHKALKEAFEYVINQKVGETFMAELLSEYADSVLKKGGIRLDDAKLSETMDNIVRLFSYLADKDMFSEFYRKQLSKRLLLQRSASDESEKIMIGKLKMKCGAQFTSKLEGMMNDMKSADDHQIAFELYKRNNPRKAVDGAPPFPDVDFSVQTLTTGFWPSYQEGKENINLNPLMQSCVDQFTEYYNSKTENRLLTWHHQLGTLSLTGNFQPQKLELKVTTLQASILLIFNTCESISIQEITSRLGVPLDPIKANLRLFVNPKMKILIKTPSEGFDVKHLMSVNKKFTSQTRVIKVPNAITQTSNAERAKAHEAVVEDRKHTIEGCIVRIMKSRKKMTHPQLMEESMTQLQKYFSPEVKQIKPVIEDLITRDYLSRDPDQNNVYHYVA